ncbi:uncharacterized protein LTR77_002003 [Saxophila tyrrhenica]|uniref:Energy transducer TonB n=1 Tax=Saxophila tyrrhenica TaxID=1690608 RepID=A0AAV9PK40_9PEZI|nr:hypothetical protein LTR77_002003 [Saxophila tyrrhenica]
MPSLASTPWLQVVCGLAAILFWAIGLGIILRSPDDEEEEQAVQAVPLKANALDDEPPLEALKVLPSTDSPNAGDVLPRKGREYDDDE